MTAPNPAPDADQPSTDVFLTPRVIDHTAFMRYTRSLKALVDEAQAKQRSLDSTKGDASSMAGTIRDLLDELRTKMETAVRLIPTIDQRADRAQAVIDQLENTEELRTDLAMTFKQRLETIIREAIATATNDLKPHLERAARAEGAATAAIEAVEKKAAEVGKVCRDLHDQADATKTTADTAAAQLSGLIAKTAHAEAGLEQLEERAKGILATAGAERLEELAEDAQAKVTRLESRLARAEALTSNTEETSLTRIIERAEDLAPIAESARSDLHSLTQQAESARSMLGENLLEAVDQIDRLEAERERLVSAVGKSIEVLRRESPALEHGLGSLENRVNEIRESIGQLQADSATAGQATERVRSGIAEIASQAERTIAEHEQRAERLSQWVASLVAKADAIERQRSQPVIKTVQPAPAQVPAPAPASAAEAAEAPPTIKVMKLERQSSESSAGETGVRFRRVGS